MVCERLFEFLVILVVGNIARLRQWRHFKRFAAIEMIEHLVVQFMNDTDLSADMFGP